MTGRRRFIRQSVIVLSATLHCAFAAQPGHARSNVRDFGAKGDGVSDDAAAIETAIRATPARGAVVFPAGVYLLGRRVRIASNLRYRGVAGATIRAARADFAFSTPYDQTKDIWIDGLAFDGGGISFDGSSVPATHVTITNCTFKNIVHTSADWTTRNAIFVPSGMVDSTISRNRFSNILESGLSDAKDREANGIHAWRLSRVTITDNVFDTVNQAITVEFNGAGPYSDVVIARNTGRRVHRMGIELQGANTSQLLVDGNQFTTFLDPFWNTYGMSIVVDGGADTVVQNNILDAEVPPASGRFGTGIELGGRNTIAQGNRVKGHFSTGIAIGRAPNAIVRGNHLCVSASNKIGFETTPPVTAIIVGNTIGPICE